ncbi:MAG: ChbG/HpnK family deacetylase [Chitinophagaceae bacterium]|nr:ChbG/HpnK family deacetylase [Chitinophagaceae bacterium]MCB9046917.1 ChbG/HpnK family deacetylase [Chitinophagales bacterium]
MAGVIINSDDFGYNPETNEAIEMAFDKGYISSTSMLTNFNEGFADARTRINNGSVSSAAVGIHLNLTEGTPLTSGIKTQSRFCDGRAFHGKARQTKMFRLNDEECKAVHNELNAQLEQFKTLGFPPSHIDSHHHVHTEWAVMSIVATLAKEHNIKKIRLSRNTGAGISKFKNMYKLIFNKMLVAKGFRCTQLMGDIDDYMNSGLPGNAIAEIMVHAVFTDGMLTDMDGKELGKKLSQLSFDRSSLMNFSQL